MKWLDNDVQTDIKKQTVWIPDLEEMQFAPL